MTIRRLWLIVVVLAACGGQQPSDNCAQMLACDSEWSASVLDRPAVFMGDEDPVYGRGGTCWSGTDEDDAVCDAACLVEFARYREVLDSQVLEGELIRLPDACVDGAVAEE